MLTIKVAEASDYQRIADFCSAFDNDVHSSEDWIDMFHHWWEDNPAFTEGMPRGVLLMDGDRITGHAFNFPMEFQYNFQPVTVLNGTTWRVLPESRGMSIDLWFKHRELTGGGIYFNTTPTPQVTKLIKRMGYQPVPWGDDFDHWWSTSLLTLASKKQKGRLFRMAAAVFDVFEPAIRLVRMGKADKRYLIKRLDHAGEEFDELWEKTRNQYACTNVRKSANVNWHARYNQLFGCYYGDKLVGYYILMAQPGASRLQLADLWYDHEHDILKAVIHRTITEARRQKLGMVVFPHFNTALSQKLRTSGLFTKQCHAVAYYKDYSKEKRALLPDTSYLVRLQGDFGQRKA